VSLSTLSRESTYSWLSILSSLRLVDEDALRDLILHCPVPLGVVDLPHRRTLMMSPPMASLLGLDPTVPGQLDVAVFAGDPMRIAALFDLMSSGAISAYAAQREFTHAAGATVTVDVWAAVCPSRPHDRAVVIVNPADRVLDVALPRSTLATWPDQVGGLVVGVFTGSWVIERISVDVEGLLGHVTEDLIGTSILDLLDHDGATAVFAAVAGTLADGIGSGTSLALRHADGSYVQGRMVLTPLAEDGLHIGFAFVVGASPVLEPGARAAVLERHMRRIAREVELASIVTAGDPAELGDTGAAMSSLSERQWEILSQLLQGQRVPAIAANLYVGQSTVRNHLTGIYRKFGVHSQQELLDHLRANRAAPGSGRPRR